MNRRLAAVSALLVLSLAAAPTPAAAAGSLTNAMAAAAQTHNVPAPLVEAIVYINTIWEPIAQPSLDGGVGPMNVRPALINQAAALSNHSVAQIRTDPQANLDAGASLLAHFHTVGADLDSWRPAVAATLGDQVAAEVYDILSLGARRTTSSGETIVLPAQPVSTGIATVRGGASSLTSAEAPIAVSTDYPPAAWIPASPSNYSSASRPHDSPVDMIIIHDTEGSYGSAIQEFQNGATQASAHYVVSRLGQITQMVAEHDIAWHAGNWDYNTRAIGIEHEGFAYRAGWYTTAEYQASAQLAASICSRWGVPMDRQHVIGHSDVPDPNKPGQFGGAGHHTDPGPYWDWNYFIGQAASFASKLPSPPHLGPDPTAVAGSQKATVVWQAAHTCYAPITGYTVVAQPGNLTQTLPASSTSAVFSGLQNGVAYTFTVTAQNAQGQDSLTSRKATPNPLPFAGLYTIDAFGGVHADESAPLTGSAYWGGWRIARTAKTLPVPSGAPQTGFVLDGWGGLHRFGAAIVETSGAANHYWPGWDIARDFAFLPSGLGGIVLDGYGGLHGFGINGNPAPQLQGYTYWGWDIARKVVIFADGSGGYVLDGWGGLHPFGINGPPPANAGPISGGSYWPGWDIARDVVLTVGNGNHSGYLLDGWGGIHPFHSTADASAMPTAIATPYFGWDIARTLWLGKASTAAAPKGFVLNGWGELFPIGAVGTPDAATWPGWDIIVGLTGQ